jgi:hypothetical protein
LRNSLLNSFYILIEIRPMRGGTKIRPEMGGNAPACLETFRFLVYFYKHYFTGALL